jgi:hypothetical protein
MGKGRVTPKSKTTPLKERRLSDLRGIFPATKPYVGVEATRQYVAHQLGEEPAEAAKALSSRSR